MSAPRGVRERLLGSVERWLPRVARRRWERELRGYWEPAESTRLGLVSAEAAAALEHRDVNVGTDLEAEPLVE